MEDPFLPKFWRNTGFNFSVAMFATGNVEAARQSDDPVNPQGSQG